MITKPKILVIEDNLINVKVIVALLQDLGYENLTIATCGQAGLAQFDHTVALVILDIGLPDINGIEVAKQLRQQSKIPIIAYTAFNAPKDQSWQINGITDYLIKPVTWEKLNQLIQQHLPLAK